MQNASKNKLKYFSEKFVRIVKRITFDSTLTHRDMKTYRVTQSVGNSCLSMRRVLSVIDFSTESEAVKCIPVSKVSCHDVNTSKPYFALTSIEHGCVHTSIGFYQ